MVPSGTGKCSYLLGSLSLSVLWRVEHFFGEQLVIYFTATDFTVTVSDTVILGVVLVGIWKCWGDVVSKF